MKSGIELIRDEREKQIIKHGYTVQHDVETTTTSALIKAAESYIESSECFAGLGFDQWPWDKKFYKPESMKRDLIKAGALIAAAIDRLNAEWLRDGPRLQYRYAKDDSGRTLFQASVFWFLNGFPQEVASSGYQPTKLAAVEEVNWNFIREQAFKTQTAYGRDFSYSESARIEGLLDEIKCKLYRLYYDPKRRNTQRSVELENRR